MDRAVSGGRFVVTDRRGESSIAASGRFIAPRTNPLPVSPTDDPLAWAREYTPVLQSQGDELNGSRKARSGKRSSERAAQS